MLIDKFKKLYKCDECGIEFHIKAKAKIQQQFHFHNRECMNKSMKNGILRSKTDETSLSKYGTLNPAQSQHVKQKMQQTCLDRYGVRFATSNNEIRSKMSKTAIQTFAKNGEEIQARRRKTNQIKRGVDYPMSDPIVRAKSIKTCNERYGCDNPAKLQITHDKAVNTLMKRYGVKNTMSIPGMYDRIDWKKASVKRHETMKREGTYRKSKPENKFYTILCDKFGTDNVERQCFINKWPIDFYVKSIGTYIQLDGVYWHGLDRPIELIAEHKTKRDVQIHKKWLTDREQDKWFITNNLTLVRITEMQLKCYEINL